MTHPYRSMPDSAHWARSVSQNWNVKDLPSPAVLVDTDQRVASAGSCFAANIVPYLERAGIEYVRTERRHPAFKHLESDRFSYEKFSAAYGNIYTVRQAAQLIRRALGEWRPVEDRWHAGNAVIDPFRPGLRYPAASDREFDALTEQHLAAVLEAMRRADVFIFTLGLTEAWLSAADGAVFPACPGTVAGEFDEEQHVFHNFSVAEVTSDLDDLISLCRRINSNLRFILTVSPVPLVATASGQHVLQATTYSKSVLRVAADQATRSHEGVSYFPAYEIVTGPQAPAWFFEADRRSPSQQAINAVMQAFLSRCKTSRRPRWDHARAADTLAAQARALSAAVVEAECEEAAAGV